MKTATAKSADPSISRMICDRCDTQLLIISPKYSPYPVKLPGHCPCCMNSITEYRFFDGEIINRSSV